MTGCVVKMARGCGHKATTADHLQDRSAPRQTSSAVFRTLSARFRSSSAASPLGQNRMVEFARWVVCLRQHPTRCHWPGVYRYPPRGRRIGELPRATLPLQPPSNDAALVTTDTADTYVAEASSADPGAARRGADRDLRAAVNRLRHDPRCSGAFLLGFVALVVWIGWKMMYSE